MNFAERVAAREGLLKCFCKRERALRRRSIVDQQVLKRHPSVCMPCLQEIFAPFVQRGYKCLPVQDLGCDNHLLFAEVILPPDSTTALLAP